MKWYYYLIGFIILSGGVVYKMTRGIRNKNPGNIRYTVANQWNGQTGQDGAGFAIFSDSKFGIRAMGKTIDSYQRRGVRSIRQIISTWAPSNENNTAEYIRSVVGRMDIPGADFIPSRIEGDFVDLVKAIIKHENGVNPYSDEEIKTGLNLV